MPKSSEATVGRPLPKAAARRGFGSCVNGIPPVLQGIRVVREWDPTRAAADSRRACVHEWLVREMDAFSYSDLVSCTAVVTASGGGC